MVSSAGSQLDGLFAGSLRSKGPRPGPWMLTDGLSRSQCRSPSSRLAWARWPKRCGMEAFYSAGEAQGRERDELELRPRTTSFDATSINQNEVYYFKCF